MTWKEKAVAVSQRFGPPIKFAVRQVVVGLAPGGPAVVELLGQLLDSVYRTSRGALEIDDFRLPSATAGDQTRLEAMLDVLGGELAGLTEQTAALEGLPDAATKVLDVALRTDDRCRTAARKLDAVAQSFDALGEQYRRMLRLQGCGGNVLEEVVPLMRRTVGATAFVEDLCGGGLTAELFRLLLTEFREGLAATAGGRLAEARTRLEALARSRPTSAAAAVALAAALAANQDLSGAQKSVARASRLRPQDAGLAELARRLTLAAPTAPAPAAPLPQAARPEVKIQPQRPAGALVANALGMKFAWIPAGRFVMGSPPDEAQRRDDETQHWVTLTRGFWLGIHPVTQAQWEALMEENPSRFEGADLPVERIVWRDAFAFCRALGKQDGKSYRLPTEAEWEYACRADTITTFHCGDAISSDQANYDGNYTYGGRRGVYRETTTPVGSFAPNRWGLFDMHGNVREWCQDWYAGAFPPDDVTDPQGGESGGFRVLRGGSWRDYPADCRSAARHPRGPALRDDNVGFRVVLVMD